MSYMLLLFGMVDIETVLVLGAGASKAFGFPTGEELVKEIYTILDKRTGGLYTFFYETAGQQSTEMADKFPSVLKQANPFSVNAWLEHNPNYIEVGKFAIAIALLRYENRSNLRPNNNWYQLLSKRLDGPFEKFQDNKLSIITFNYDRSLEQYLFETFRHMHTEKSEKECKEKLNQLRILHVYGSMGPLEWQSEYTKHRLPLVPYVNKLDRNTIYFAAEGIKIIPQKSSSPSKEFTEAQDLISKAKALYFLGFGYSKDNMERLGIKTLRMPQKIMGTAKGLGYQEYQEVRRMSIFNIPIEDNLLDDKTVYEFLHDCVDFNSLD